MIDSGFASFFKNYTADINEERFGHGDTLKCFLLSAAIFICDEIRVKRGIYVLASLFTLEARAFILTDGSNVQVCEPGVAPAIVFGAFFPHSARDLVDSSSKTCDMQTRSFFAAFFETDPHVAYPSKLIQALGARFDGDGVLDVVRKFATLFDE